MSTDVYLGEQRVVLRSVSWSTYEALVSETECAGRRLTYDQGVLELMSPGMPHETAKRLIGRMIETYSLHQGIDIRSTASTTFKRSELRRGFEADESYYIQNASVVVGVRELDLSIHPPPDLVVEIDFSNSSLPKQSLFASLQVPEVWRFDGSVLMILGLDQDRYVELDASRALPQFPIQAARALLARRDGKSETKLLQQFVEQIQ